MLYFIDKKVYFDNFSEIFAYILRVFKVITFMFLIITLFEKIMYYISVHFIYYKNKNVCSLKLHHNMFTEYNIHF